MPTVKFNPSDPEAPKGRIDRARVDAMTDEEIERNAAEDEAEATFDLETARLVLAPLDVAALRRRLGMSQAQFAAAYGFAARTVQDWEQGRREPEQSARAYLRAIAGDPEAVRRAFKAAE